MKSKIILIVFLSLVYLIPFIISSCGTSGTWKNCIELRKKKPNKHWCIIDIDNIDDTRIDGNTDLISITTTTEPSRNPHHDPICDPYDPPLPDFSHPGQRLSVTRCHEYIWDMKVRFTRQERDMKCRISKIPNWDELDNHNLTKRHVSEELKPLGENYAKSMPQILGGHDAFPKEYPHMGAVGWISSNAAEKWKFMCGSSLISANFVLTAAHCIQAPSDTSITDTIPKIVRFGVEDIIAFAPDHSAVDRFISKIIPHPNYASPLKYFDIALFELDKPVVFTKFVHPACLWTEDIDRVTEGNVTGWGVTSTNAHEGHPYLQAAPLPVIDSAYCDLLLRKFHSRRWRGLQDHQFCGGQMNGGIDACGGDSGGPYQMRIPTNVLPEEITSSEGNMHYVFGITSFGIGCGSENIPGVYTKVSYFLDWIEKQVWG